MTTKTTKQKPSRTPRHVPAIATVLIIMISFVALGSWGAMMVQFTSAQEVFLTIAQINALGRAPSWWERLVIEDGYPLIVLYALLTIPSWMASILARSSEWYLGGIIGAVMGAVVGYLLSSVQIGLLGAVMLGLVGALFDHHVSAHYRQRRAIDQHPSWWAGGRHGVAVWKHITG
ncbi:hypothetical protein HZA86_01800 [Candidatus Uhrbacteria bacterium]|nr:hypothetical protein [Candidatus Uhrbacteria bacterium]